MADASWGQNVSNYLVALATGSLQKAGGAFTLTSEVDFGATYGLKAPYFKSKGAIPALTGVLRLANLTDSVSWRNAANSADLALLVDASNNLTFNGAKIGVTGGITPSDLASGFILPANLGGTGVANNALSTITVTGSYGIVFTVTAATALTLPLTGTLSTLANAETLTNKTLAAGTLLTAGKITTAVAEVDPTDQTKQWNATLAAAATGTATTFAFAQTANRTITFPDATDTVALLATAQTLTNKTLTSPALNTPTISSAQDTNTTWTSYGDLTEIATPAAPAAGKVRIYSKAGDRVYIQSPAGVETILAVGNPLTNPMTTLGDTIYEDGTPSAVRLAGNITATRKFLRQTGTGSVSAAPAWDILLGADVPVVTSSTAGVVPATSGLGQIRLNTSGGYGSTNTKIRRWTTSVTSTGSDITYADSVANGGSFTINTSGVYAITYCETFTALAYLGISVNTSQPATTITSIIDANRLAISSTVSASQPGSCSYCGFLNAGDVIRAHTDGTGQAAANNLASFCIQRVV